MKTHWRAILPIAALVLAVVLTQVLISGSGRPAALNDLVVTAYHAIVAMGLCLVMGYAGQVSLGHGAFFAIGGYTSAVLTTTPIAMATDGAPGALLLKLGILVLRQDPYGGEFVTAAAGAAFVVAMGITLVVALLIGYPALRLKGHYLAMATLGFGLIVYRIILGSDFTNSADGIYGVPAWQLAPGVAISGKSSLRILNYYVAWGLVILVLVFLLNLVRSRSGRAFRAIHDHELAANAMGIDTSRLKLQAFVLSALLAAGAGCFLTHYNRGIGPSSCGAMQSVRYVALVAAGGTANLWGVLAMSSVLNFCSLRGLFGTMDHAVFGTILIVIVSVAPDGPFRAIRQLLTRKGERRAA